MLPRTSVFVRQASGREHEEQIVAANVDVVFLVSAMDNDFNVRRIERYLTLAWESGAMPTIVLSKADRSSDAARIIAETERVAPGVPVLLTSAKSGEGVEALRARLAGHKTGALLGSSGVGKSTLINALVGHERQATAEVRPMDGKGRHTTTWRELVRLPGGGLLIDTPGMREVQIVDADEGRQTAFSEIEALAAECAFRDCTHGPEPGCAVKKAVAEGRLQADRLASYHKLEAEAAHRALKGDQRALAARKAADKSADKLLNKQVKDKKSKGR